MGDQRPPGRWEVTQYVTVARTYRSWGELKGAAVLIVLGTAGEQTTQMFDNRRGDRRPDTVTTEVHVEQELLGKQPTPRVVRVRQFGGVTPDGGAARVVGYPRLERGQRYLLFLLPETDGAHFTVGVYQGAFTVHDELVNSISREAAETGIPVRNEPLDRIIGAIEAAPAVMGDGACETGRSRQERRQSETADDGQQRTRGGGSAAGNAEPARGLGDGEDHLHESLRRVGESREMIAQLRHEAPELYAALETILGVVAFHSKQIARLDERIHSLERQGEKGT